MFILMIAINFFLIGHGGKSKTTNPGVIYDLETDIIFCDCPGFFDNRGDLQDITQYLCFVQFSLILLNIFENY